MYVCYVIHRLHQQMTHFINNLQHYMMFEVLESAWRDWYTTHAHLSSDIPLVSYPLHSPLTPFSDAHQN